MTYGGPRSVMEGFGATVAVKTTVILAQPGRSVARFGVPTAQRGGGIAFAKNLSLRVDVALARASMERPDRDAATTGTLDSCPIASQPFAFERLDSAYRAMDR